MRSVNRLGGRKSSWNLHCQKETILAVEGVEKVLHKEDGSYDITLSHPEVGRTLFDLATADGYIPMFNQQPPTLEEIFKRKAGKKDNE